MRFQGTFLKGAAGFCLGLWIAVSIVSCASLETRTWDFSPGGTGAVTVAHISDLHMSDRSERYSQAARRILEAKPDILLGRNPGLAGGLFLAGHTHGGQVTLFGWPPLLPRGSGEFVDGHYVRQGNNLLVSRGLGYSGLPLRFWADFDILLVRI